MNIPSVSEYMVRLDGNPQVAATFAAANPGRSRLEAVQACHKLAVATLSEIQANKAKLVAARQKIAALTAARKSQPTTSFMKTTTPPVKAPTSQTTVSAASFASKPLTMLRSEFQKLSEADKTRFAKNKGKLV